MALLKICRICSEATAQSATTIAAVINVMSTQPGTSPRSATSRRASRAPRSGRTWAVALSGAAAGGEAEWADRCSRMRWTDMGASSGGGNGSCGTGRPEPRWSEGGMEGGMRVGRAGRGGGEARGGGRGGGGWGGLARHRVGISSDRDLQNGQAREDGEDDDQGKDQEHDRDEHRDLAPPGGLHEFALGGLAGVL